MLRNRKSALALLSLIAAVVAFLLITGSWREWSGMNPMEVPDTEPHEAGKSKGGAVTSENSDREILYWYDPMVPQHRFEQPGKSPFMDMQLVPKYADEVAEGSVQISPQTAQSLGIRTALVTRERFSDKVRAVGEIKPNERLIDVVQTRVGGFVEKLLVRAEGDPVSQGQKLAEVYAPELLAAQEELLALNRLKGLPDIEQLQEGARSRLRLLGMGTREIRAIEASGQTTDRVGIYAQGSGIVQRLGVREGAAVNPGDSLFEILDLSTVWLNLDVPERQLGRIADAQDVEVTVPAYPGEVFHGVVDYIYPTVNNVTRTVPVRVVLDNPEQRLKPGFYAEAEIRSNLREGLWIPSEALIVTGERSVAIVKQAEGFRPAKVRTGQQRGDKTEILAGLSEGEQVVVSGQFLIDSEASLSGFVARLTGVRPEAEADSGKEPITIERHQGRGVLEEMDMDSGILTLTHEPIPSLDWPAMTMPFKLRNPHLLHGAQPGQTLQFEINPVMEGGYYIIENATVLGDQP